MKKRACHSLIAPGMTCFLLFSLFSEDLGEKFAGFYYIFLLSHHFEVAQVGQENDEAGCGNRNDLCPVAAGIIHHHGEDHDTHQGRHHAGIENDHQDNAQGNDDQKHPGTVRQDQSAEGCQTFTAVKAHGKGKAVTQNGTDAGDNAGNAQLRE